MNQENHSWKFADTPLRKSLLWSLAISILPVVSGFVVSWVVARWAGPIVIGTVSWVMAFATACLILGKFGIGVAASRLASEYGVKATDSLRPLLKVGIELRLFFTIPVAISVFLLSSPIARAFGSGELEGPLRIGAVVILCASLYEFSEHFLVGLNLLSTVYRIRAAYHALRILLTISVVMAGLEAMEILSGYCLAWILAIGLYLLLLFKHLPRRELGAKEGEIRKRLFILSVPLAVSGASVALYSQMDKLMLGYFCTMGDVGQYTVARNITEVSLFPVFAVIMALRPALASKYSTGNLKECARVIKTSMFASIVSGILFTTIFLVMAKPLVVFVFSDKYNEAGAAMLFFAWLIVMRSMGSVILPGLVAAEKTKTYALLTVISAIVNFFLNLILIPKWSIYGAIAATIASYAVLLVAGILGVKRTFRVIISGADLISVARVFVAAVISGLIVRKMMPIFSHPASVLLGVVLLSILYIFLLFLLGIFRPEKIKKLGSASKIDN